MNMHDIEWLYNLKKEVDIFLNHIKSSRTPGFFSYTLSGDLYSDSAGWGLGNAVFVTKIYYTLGLLDDLSNDQRKGLYDFIVQFQNKDGSFSDPLIKRKSCVRDKLVAFRKFNFNNFFHTETVRAETRQAISALKLLDPDYIVSYRQYPQTVDAVKGFLEKLDWSKPWNAGSHFSHLMFFLSHGNIDNKTSLIDYAVEWVNKIQHEDGVWYTGKPSLQEKINGAMKVMTGLRVANRLDFRHPEKLIDLCLVAANDGHACDNFNVVYVLYHSSIVLQKGYRSEEIKAFAFNRLDIYKQYYHPDMGGFSFFISHSNTHYYGAKVSKGLSEPDVHGTVMFLWGLSIIVKILDLEKGLGFQEFVT
ncbi:hypothetical protein C0581_02930 [Candidatus Parcubacteria bacterium]|nr:MAG: hypothetical protein C0581_02930 [Candidatus Parcubacteria bacterium]